VNRPIKHTGLIRASRLPTANITNNNNNDKYKINRYNNRKNISIIKEDYKVFYNESKANKQFNNVETTYENETSTHPRITIT
jgi:hypothetical protein